MFTGLIQKVGRLRSLAAANGGRVISIDCPPWRDGALRQGESVAVQGCCLTVCDVRDGGFSADVLEETFSVTALRHLGAGAALNLERALRPCDRLGGHLVQGHVDGTARILAIEPAGRDVRIRLQCGGDSARYVVYKGSIAIDGTSLTVSNVADGGVFEVNIIPTTLRETSLGERRTGDFVNVETDIVGRYVESFLAARENTNRKESNLTLAFLEKAGFLNTTTSPRP
ncbi:MAG: riboflavin synthase [Kiritimatiellae bacterium]|nr:riboflavin synthase [Kiritimatiellia bacterium]